MVQLREKQKFQIKIKRLGINGEGIGYHQKMIIFVANALPDEEVLVQVTKTTHKYAYAKIIKILKPSKDRVQPACAYYDACGGCQLMHLNYQAQLDFKRDLLKQALEKFKPTGYQNYELRPTIGMKNPWHYRNKAQFQLRFNPKLKKIEAGLYKENSHQLVAIENCLVQEETTQKVLNTVVRLLNRYQIPIYNEKKKTGILKTLMVRVGIETGEVQLVLISTKRQIPNLNSLLRLIQSQCPEVVSIMQNIQAKQTSLVMGDETIHLAGKEAITEQINEVVFDLSARAFFQLNPTQTKILYDEAIKACTLTGNESVVDAYCGVGTIGLSIAKQVKEVRGMDIIPSAIEDAKKNAQRLGVANTHYEVGTAEDLLPKWLAEGFQADVIIVDPPRTGLDGQLLNALLKYPSQQLVYVSCNVSTLAKNLVTLSQKYRVDYLQSVDMFPHTARCEVVCKLTLK